MTDYELRIRIHRKAGSVTALIRTTSESIGGERGLTRLNGNQAAFFDERIRAMLKTFVEEKRNADG